MISGQKVYLAALERDDLEQLRNWRNQEDFRKNFREYREINKDMQTRWYENRVLNDEHTIMFGIHDRNDDSLIGCCGLCYINFVNRNADISLYIGKDNAYIDDQGYAEESLKLLSQ